MGTIAIEGMQFHAFHGYYPKERRTGNLFEVDVYIETDCGEAAETDDLEKTVNYEKLYTLTAEVMAGRYKLLEHIASQILNKIDERLERVDWAKVKVSKMNPPIKGQVKRTFVELERRFN